MYLSHWDLTILTQKKLSCVAAQKDVNLGRLVLLANTYTSSLNTSYRSTAPFGPAKSDDKPPVYELGSPTIDHTSHTAELKSVFYEISDDSDTESESDLDSDSDDGLYQADEYMHSLSDIAESSRPFTPTQTADSRPKFGRQVGFCIRTQLPPVPEVHIAQV